MTNEKTAETQDFLILIFLGFLILNAIGYIYEKNEKIINTPQVKISYAILQITARITKQDSTANKVIRAVSRDKLPTLTIAQQHAINAAAGHYVRYLLLVYGVIAIVSIYLRPGTHRHTKRLTLQNLIENNVKNTPCLAPIVFRDPTKPEGRKQFKPAHSPLQFVLEEKILVNATTGEYIQKEELLNDDDSINVSAPIIATQTPCVLLQDKIQQIAERQLGQVYSHETQAPDYIKSIWAAMNIYAKNPKKGQNAFDQLSLCFLNKTNPNDIDLTTPAVEQYYQQPHQSIPQEPINLVMAKTFQTLTAPPLSTAQFLWLRLLDRTLWYTLNQIGYETYWSDAIAVGIAIDNHLNNPSEIAAYMLPALQRELSNMDVIITKP